MMSLTPLFGSLIGLLLSIFLIIGTVWFDWVKPSNSILYIVFQGFRGILFSIYAYYGFLLLDTVLKIGFFGIISYSNISYHIGSLILMVIFGVMIMIGTVFSAPTKKTIIIFGFLIGISIFFLWTSAGNMILASEEKSIMYKPVSYILLVTIAVEAVWDTIKFLLKRNPFDNKRIWDFTENKNFRRFFNIKVYFILWILFSIETLLKMEGMGLFYWL
jgi:hypothetical protein